MKRYLATLPIVAAPALLAAFLAAPKHEDVPPNPPTVAPAPQPTTERKIQVAILLDNSGSMSGLIDQARSELWTIVNALAEASHGQARPKVEVALFAYGAPPSRQLVPFTTDLDRVSEALFALTIDGGDEYCGEAIDIAVRDLAWSDDADDMKLIFIAGNEPFTQGPIAYPSAIANAQKKGVVVNAIHCGPEKQDGPEWQQAALLARGSFANIDHDAKVAHVATPFDEEIARLGIAMNATYLPYGALGAASSARQNAQDKNASGMSLGTSVRRGLSKASRAYDNAQWDLVDAQKQGKKVADLREQDLPPALQGLDPAARQAKVDAMAKERADVQQKIGALNAQREAFLKAQRKENAQDTLDEAVLQALGAQAKAKGFTLPGA